MSLGTSQPVMATTELAADRRRGEHCARAAHPARSMLTDDALTKLYEQYGHLVHRRCLSLVRNAADAEDALQETFLRVRRYSASPQNGSTLGWLYTIAANVCFDLVAKKRREEPVEDEVLSRRDTRHTGDGEDADRRAVLGAVLRTLDGNTRTMGVLHYLDGFTQEEVAEQTGYSRKTVGKKLKNFEELVRRAWSARAGKEPS